MERIFTMTLNPRTITVFAEMDGKTHQIVLTERERKFVGMTIREMHNGSVKVSKEPIEGLVLNYPAAPEPPAPEPTLSNEDLAQALQGAREAIVAHKSKPKSNLILPS